MATTATEKMVAPPAFRGMRSKARSRHCEAYLWLRGDLSATVQNEYTADQQHGGTAEQPRIQLGDVTVRRMIAVASVVGVVTQSKARPLVPGIAEAHLSRRIVTRIAIR
jgi:hypothetical protein